MAKLKFTDASSGKAIPTDLVTTGQASEAIGIVARSTVIHWCNIGKLKCYRDNGRGWRRVSLRDVKRAAGLIDEEKSKEKTSRGEATCFGYARVSTNAQSKGHAKGSRDSDLGRQISDLEAASRKETGQTAIIYADTGSGLNFSRKNLTRLIADVMSGRWDFCKCFVTYQDRWCRWGMSLVAQILEFHNIQIVYIKSHEIEHEEQESFELVSDFLAVSAVFTAKLNGSKAKERTQRTICPQGIQLITRLHAKGMSHRDIHKEVIRRHHYEQGGDISRSGVQKVIRNLQKLKLVEVPDTTSPQRFFDECLVITQKKTDKIKFGDIEKAYIQFCKDQDCISVARVNLGYFIASTKCPRFAFRNVVHYGRLKWKKEK